MNGDERLSKKVQSAIENKKNTNIVSIASIWEIAIKLSLNKIKLPKGLNHFIGLIEDNGFVILPISLEHTLSVSSLDFIHRDPFDRILIAQSKVEKLVIITKDENIRKYSVDTIW